MPRVNAVESAQEWRIEVEVAGVPATELAAHVSAGTLTVRGRRPQSDGGAMRRCEMPAGPFTLKLPMPRGIDASRSQARLRDGVLVIRLPKGDGYAEGERAIGIESINK